MTALARPLHEVQESAFAALTSNIPYIRFLGVDFTRRGDEVTGRLAYAPELIGNPMLPALHGGATGAFLEITAQIALAWVGVLERIGDGTGADEGFPPQPKTIDFGIDYLRSGKPQDAFARALILRRGRRVANVRVEAWQDERARPFIAGHGHFLMPQEEQVP